MGKHEVKRAVPRCAGAKRPAVFLDRDGTLIRHVDDIVRRSQIKILKGAPEALKIFRTLGFRLIVITNQPVISKGLINQKGVDALHRHLNSHFKKHGVALDAFYTCPHRHWDYCLCRKPQIGSVKKAVAKYNLDLRNSFFIGDTFRDVATGKNAKLKTILVATGKGGSDYELFTVKPDYKTKNILTAAKLVRRIACS